MQTSEQKKIVIKLPQLRIKSILAIGFFLLLLAGFAFWYRNIRPYLALSNAYVNAYSTVLSSDQAGRIVEMGPQEGDLVKKGDLLFGFEREFLLAKQAQLKTMLNQINQQIDSEKNRMAKAMDGYLAAENRLELGIGQAGEVEKQLKIMEEAQSKSEEVQSKATPIKTELGLIQLELKKGTFLAPFDGVILKRYKNEGAVVSHGDSVYSLCDPERIWIEAEISEKQVQKVALGSLAKVRVNAYPNRVFMGKVSYIGVATKAKAEHLPFAGQSPTIPIKISLDSGDFSLMPGLSAKVALKVR